MRSFQPHVCFWLAQKLIHEGARVTYSGAAVVCSGPKSSSAQPSCTGPYGCCRGRRNMLGRCSSSHALMNWAFCTRSRGPRAPGEVRRDAKLPCPRRRKLNVSLRAVLCDPLSTFWFCISMIPLHNKPGKNKTP